MVYRFFQKQLTYLSELTPVEIIITMCGMIDGSRYQIELLKYWFQ